MIDDFVPIVHNLEGRPIKIWPIGDVHIGAKEADIEGFAEFIDRIKDDEDSYVVLVGDLINNGIRDSLSDVFDEVIPPSKQVELAAELLSPIKSRILGSVGGNHEQRSKRQVDYDPCFQILTLLRIPELYRPNFAFIRINLIKETGNSKIKDHYAIFITHGKSASKQKRFAQSAIEGVDAIIQGHTHSGVVEKSARLVLNYRNKVSMKPMVIVTAPSWLSYGGYAIRNEYIPTATSCPQALFLDFTGSNNSKKPISVIW